MVPHLLHGTLLVTIFEIDQLHLDSRFGFFRRKTTRTQTLGNSVLGHVKRMVLCRPETVGSKLYATVDLEKARAARTSTIENQSSKPRWFESFHVLCAHMVANIIFTIKDDNPIGATLIGRAYIPVEDVINGFIVDKWVEILDENHNPIHRGSRIHVKLQFFNVRQDKNWSQGIKTPEFEGVLHTFFNQRHGCKVTLYQDAHISNIPRILLSGEKYEPRRCWEDIFDKILNAKHLIYITGWSLYTEITLIRDPMLQIKGSNLKLGELLKRKANEGVTVLILVWDDRTSVGELKRDGLMATHDQEAWEYFRNTNVRCFLCPRNPDGAKSEFQGLRISTFFTHHQKTITVDSDMPGGMSQKRRIVSFVGGIDLCDGRYDTQEHPLFSTLGTIHHDDFHQPNFARASIKKGGPREPWHDIHCQLEGPIAWDVLYNFEQRWRKQVGKDFILSRSKLDEIITQPLPITSANDLQTWNVQLFRSIDSGAAFGFPREPREAAAIGLLNEKGSIIDRSIHEAYISAIRRAKNFIYIENQYFLGSSFGWSADGIKVEDIGALHLIPKELSLKIVSKIEAGESFAVYIVIPMWPEGLPDSASVQAILDWQRRTMEMMYTDIAQALQAKGLNANLKEYLMFFCLGNRETKKIGEYIAPEIPEPDTDYSRAQKFRRFMIYVHSKMMIVDDEYIIIGSANINQRSMDGGRDTEIAMGAYQPHYLASTEPARGQIFGFRMALWYEHLGIFDHSFIHPETIQCIKAVNHIADQNWEKYSDEIFDEDLPLHLLRYPIEISSESNNNNVVKAVVTTLPGTEFFPDTKARVRGARAEYLPPTLTT